VTTDSGIVLVQAHLILIQSVGHVSLVFCYYQSTLRVALPACDGRILDYWRVRRRAGAYGHWTF